MSHHYCEYEDDELRTRYIYITKKRRTNKEIIRDLKKDRRIEMSELKDIKSEFERLKKEKVKREKKIKKLSNEIKRRS